MLEKGGKGVRNNSYFANDLDAALAITVLARLYIAVMTSDSSSVAGGCSRFSPLSLLLIGSQLGICNTTLVSLKTIFCIYGPI